MRKKWEKRVKCEMCEMCVCEFVCGCFSRLEEVVLVLGVLGRFQRTENQRVKDQEHSRWGSGGIITGHKVKIRVSIVGMVFMVSGRFPKSILELKLFPTFRYQQIRYW